MWCGLELQLHLRGKHLTRVTALGGGANEGLHRGFDNTFKLNLTIDFDGDFLA